MFEKLKAHPFFWNSEIKYLAPRNSPQISNAIAQGETATVITTSFGNR